MTVVITNSTALVASAGNVANPTTLLPTYPNPLPATGEVVLILTQCRSATPTVATPSGWTSLLNITGTNGRIALFAKIIDGSETPGGTVNVVWSGLTTGTSGTPCIARMASVSGLDTAGGLGSIVDVAGTISNQAASTTVAAGGSAITTTRDESMVIVISTRLDDVGTWATLGVSDTVTWAKVTATSITTSGADMAMEWQWGQRVAAGSIAAKSFTLSGASSFASSGVMIALKAIRTPKVTGTVQLSLAGISTPPTRGFHRMIVRAKKTSLTGKLRVRLYEGGTARSAELESPELTTSFADYVFPIEYDDANTITSYADLEMRIFGRSEDGDATTFQVSQVYLEVPTAVAAPGPASLTPQYRKYGHNLRR